MSSARVLRIRPVSGLPELRVGDDLGRLIAGAGEPASDEVVVVSQKAVSKVEGRVRRLSEVTPSAAARELATRLDKDPALVELVLRESDRVVRAERGVLITETRAGWVCANAGIDSSNLSAGRISLLPVDGDASARRIRGEIAAASGSSPAVVVADSFGRAWRLGQADIAMVNLETAVTSRGTPAPKKFAFRAPAASLDVLRDAGVDVVTLANNHGMDYGRTGLQDTLRAAAAARLPLVGAGGDEAAAFAPWTTTVRGLRVSVLGATDVLDTFAQRDWPAGPSTSGLASAKDPAALLMAVRAASARSDVVVVYVHWGKEMATCPSDRQRSLARQLAAAGADVVVGSHAHVLQPAGRVDGAYVHYGLGNYVFYARTPQTRATGVLTVDVGADGVQRARWTPATITSGVPVPGRTGSVPPSRCAL